MPRPLCVPPGALLAWLMPAVSATWRQLLLTAALGDRTAQPTGAARRPPPIAPAESWLTGFAAAGLACLLLLTAALLALWR